MRTLLLDPFSGVAGDMFTAALLTLGLDREAFLETLNKLNIEGCYAEIEETVKSGITSLKFNVITPMGVEGPGGKFTQKKKFLPVSSSGTNFVKKDDHHHSHRSYTEVIEIIKNSELPEEVKTLSTKVFTELGKAEASIHGMSLENVHFHEVGAADAIFDICGACLAFHMLEVDKFVCRPIAVGGGVVKTAHGLLPVPAPATARLLEGIPTKNGAAEKELTTPTGAAIIKGLCDEYSNGTDGTILKTGYGAGTLTFPTHANVLKATLLESSSDSAYNTDEIKVIQCNIDDMPAEMLSAVIPKLLKNGALDVTCTPCMMKKNRQAFTLEVLCNDDSFSILAEIIIRETSTFGIRYQTWQRLKLDREFKEIDTEYGKVTVKIGSSGGEIIKISPEFDSCLALSDHKNVPVTQIYSAAQAASYPLLKKN